MIDVEKFGDFKGKRIFVTGHTGEAGAKLVGELSDVEAVVTGFAMPPDTKEKQDFFEKYAQGVFSMFGDIRNLDALKISLNATKPEIIFHLAETKQEKTLLEIFEINAMGTVNLLESARELENLEEIVLFSDTKDNGENFYTASKNAMKIMAKAYEKIFNEKGVKISYENFLDI